jgi:hypothetical protein
MNADANVAITLGWSSGATGWIVTVLMLGIVRA